ERGYTPTTWNTFVVGEAHGNTSRQDDEYRLPTSCGKYSKGASRGRARWLIQSIRCLFHLVRWATRASKIVRLNFVRIELYGSLHHAIERLVKGKGRGVLWTEPNWVHASHHKGLQIGTGESLCFEGLDLCDDLIIEREQSFCPVTPQF